MDNYFKVLRDIDVSAWIEKKPKKNKKTGETIYLSFLSWANAWDQLKRIYPDANYKVYESEIGWNYFTDGRTCWVKVGVTVEGIEHVETLPVYDFNFNPIPYEQTTSDHVNTAIQRALTKAIGRHGLGLGLYAGEDLQDKDDDLPFTFNERKATTSRDDDAADIPHCYGCGADITEAEESYSVKYYGRPLCRICQKGEPKRA